MNYIFALIVMGVLDLENHNKSYIPYNRVISTYTSYFDCNDQLISTHDYYLAKDIRKKSIKRRNPKFLKDNSNRKILSYTDGNTNYFASCKKIILPIK